METGVFVCDAFEDVVSDKGVTGGKFYATLGTGIGLSTPLGNYCQYYTMEGRTARATCSMTTR